MPVVYVTADVAGREESPVYPILNMDQKIAEMKLPEGYTLQTYTAQQPSETNRLGMKWWTTEQFWLACATREHLSAWRQRACWPNELPIPGFPTQSIRRAKSILLWP